MFNYYFQGLLLGLAYVAPIGMQNLYVINTALSGSKIRAYQVAFICTFFDIILALSCFFGMGLLIKNIPVLKGIILLAGSIFVIYIGISLVRSSADKIEEVSINKSIYEVIAKCFAVTWLNPQALIDGSLLLGSYHASIPDQLLLYFVLGFCSASCIWFFTITTIILKLQDKINQKAVKMINIICGFVLMFFGVKLGYSFIEIFMK
ncbi:MAG TPA: LysE family transporter [Thermoanaerobacterales bacterium]|nr:LysE family transporter [Thermoanaerobacterales bacterium]